MARLLALPLAVLLLLFLFLPAHTGGQVIGSIKNSYFRLHSMAGDVWPDLIYMVEGGGEAHVAVVVAVAFVVGAVAVLVVRVQHSPDPAISLSLSLPQGVSRSRADQAGVRLPMRGGPGQRVRPLLRGRLHGGRRAVPLLQPERTRGRAPDGSRAMGAGRPLPEDR